MQLEVADIQENNRIAMRDTSGKPRTRDGSATAKRKDLYEPESPLIDFGKFASSFSLTSEIKKDKTFKSPDSSAKVQEQVVSPLPLKPRTQHSTGNSVSAMPRESAQPNPSSLNQLQVPSSGGTNLGTNSNNHKADSSYAVDAILEQISKQNIGPSKQDNSPVPRSPLDDCHFERAESIDNGIEKAAKRPSSKFNYEEFKNLAGDRKPSAIEQSSESSYFQPPPLVKIISENIEHIKPRKIDPRKSIEAVAQARRPSGFMEESSIIVQINDKTGIHFDKEGDPILATAEPPQQRFGLKKKPVAPPMPQVAEDSHTPSIRISKAAPQATFADTKFRSMQETSVKNDASQLMPWPKVRTSTQTSELPVTGSKQEAEQPKLGEKDSKLILSSESKSDIRERLEVAAAHPEPQRRPRRRLRLRRPERSSFEGALEGVRRRAEIHGFTNQHTDKEDRVSQKRFSHQKQRLRVSLKNNPRLLSFFGEKSLQPSLRRHRPHRAAVQVH